MTMNTQNRNEHGNALVIIFIAVALFAALGVAFSSNSRQSTNLITDVQAEAYASSIESYRNDIKQAIKRVMLAGCSDTQISFENNTISGYTNPNSPSNKKCHIFEKAGGISIQKPFSGLNNGSDWIFTNNRIRGYKGDNIVSSDSSELMMLLPNVNLSICQKLNQIWIPSVPSWHITPPPDNQTRNTAKFTGTYSSPSGSAIHNLTISPNLNGTYGDFFCFSASGSYWIMAVLLGRKP